MKEKVSAHPIILFLSPLEGERPGEGVSEHQHTLTPTRPKTGKRAFGAQASPSSEREIQIDATWFKPDID